MDSFCKKFLDEETYMSLKANEAFVILPNNREREIDDIKIYLKHSLITYTAIFGAKHPFVQEYIVKNIDA